MTFEWDDAKNKLNIEKHELDFEDALEVFQSPMLTAPDNRYDYGEERHVAIGSIRGRVVVVVFTEPHENTVRIILLRKAVKRERVRYEQVLKNRLGQAG